MCGEHPAEFCGALHKSHLTQTMMGSKERNIKNNSDYWSGRNPSEESPPKERMMSKRDQVGSNHCCSSRKSMRYISTKTGSHLLPRFRKEANLAQPGGEEQRLCHKRERESRENHDDEPAYSMIGALIVCHHVQTRTAL